MKKKAPAYQWYPDKALADTRRLSWASNGIYRALLDTIWMQFQATCSIPDDDKYIASEIGATLQDWQTAKEEIMCPYRPLLEVREGRLFSNGLYKEKVKQEAHRQKQTENGLKGGRPKLLENKTNKPMGYLEESQTEAKKSLSSPSPIPFSSLKALKEKNIKKKNQKTLIPEVFPISDEMRDFAKSQGVENVQAVTEQFLDHFRANGEAKVDWLATWRNWMRNHLKFNSSSNSRGTNGKAQNSVTGGRSWVDIKREELLAATANQIQAKESSLDAIDVSERD